MRELRRQRPGCESPWGLKLLRRAGYTLLEITLVASVAAVVVFKVAVVLGSATSNIGAQMNQVEVDERVRIVLDRIAYQLLGSDRETLTPLNTAGMHVDGMRYRISLGVEDGEVVYSEEEEVRFVQEQDAAEVVWGESIGTAEERRITWTRLVQPYLEGEIPNGRDDNNNGLVDEEGLVFQIEDDHIEVGLTLARVDSNGNLASFTSTRYVALRN